MRLSSTVVKAPAIDYDLFTGRSRTVWRYLTLREAGRSAGCSLGIFHLVLLHYFPRLRSPCRVRGIPRFAIHSGGGALMSVQASAFNLQPSIVTPTRWRSARSPSF